MRQKPLLLRVIAFCFVFVPVVNIILTGWFNRWPLTGPRGVLEHYSQTEKFILGCYPLVAIGIWSVRRWGYFLFLAFSLFVISRNFYVLWTNQYYSRYVVLLFQVMTLSITGLLLQSHVSAPYFNPKMRWWESLPRYKFNTLGTLTIGLKKFKAEIIDLSRGGCFIKTEAFLKVGDIIKMSIPYKRVTIQTSGKVTWASDKIDGGYGIMFQRPHVLQFMLINYVVSKLKKRNSVSRVTSRTKSKGD